MCAVQVFGVPWLTISFATHVRDRPRFIAGGAPTKRETFVALAWLKRRGAQRAPSPPLRGVRETKGRREMKIYERLAKFPLVCSLSGHAIACSKRWCAKYHT